MIRLIEMVFESGDGLMLGKPPDRQICSARDEIISNDLLHLIVVLSFAAYGCFLA